MLHYVACCTVRGLRLNELYTFERIDHLNAYLKLDDPCDVTKQILNIIDSSDQDLKFTIIPRGSDLQTMLEKAGPCSGILLDLTDVRDLEELKGNIYLTL